MAGKPYAPIYDLSLAEADRLLGRDADPARANTDLYYAYHGTRSTSRSETVPSLGRAATLIAPGYWHQSPPLLRNMDG